MKSFWCISIIVSVLFMGMEGAADMLFDGLPHADEAASHEDEFGHSLAAHDDETFSGDLSDEHCKHCCHGHSAGVTGEFASISTPFVPSDVDIGCSTPVHNYAQAPPTPPPNA